MSIPLWPAGSTSMYSDIINIAPGKACILYAANLCNERCRVSDDEFKGPQAVCVRRIVYSTDLILRQRDSWCDWVVTFQNPNMAVDSLVYTGCNCWELTPNSNLRIIGVPGIYRLELNDCTAIGVTQVYADVLDTEQLPHQIAHLFF